MDHATRTSVATILAISFLGGCHTTPDRAARRAALFEADRQWARAAAGNDIEAILPFWTEDADIYAAGRPPVIGKNRITEFVTRSRAIPGYALHWEPREAVVSESGDMGYTLGPYEFNMRNRDGQPVVHRGHYISVWRHDNEGWRCTLEVHAPLPPSDGAAPAGDGD